MHPHPTSHMLCLFKMETQIPVMCNPIFVTLSSVSTVSPLLSASVCTVAHDTALVKRVGCCNLKLIEMCIEVGCDDLEYKQYRTGSLES